MRFRAQGLVHDVARVTTIDAESIPFQTVSVEYLLSFKQVLNVKYACRDGVLWIPGFDDAAFTKEITTCLACLVSP